MLINVFPFAEGVILQYQLKKNSVYDNGELTVRAVCEGMRVQILEESVAIQNSEILNKPGRRSTYEMGSRQHDKKIQSLCLNASGV